MKSKMHLHALGSLFLALSVAPAFAVLESRDDPVFGPGSLTVDTGTNLQWLDITTAVGRTFDDVAAQFGQGGEFEGFRHATVAEVNGLWSTAGIDLESNPGIPSVQALLDLVGATTMQNGFPEAAAFTADDCFSMLVMNRDLDFAGSEYFTGSTCRNRTLVFANVGHWLVRVVPVATQPGTWTYIKAIYRR